MSTSFDASEFSHLPVLPQEILTLLTDGEPKIIVDCTVGGAGHSRLLLEALPEAHLFGFDRDMSAVKAARAALLSYGDRAEVHHAQFTDLPERFAELGIEGVDAFLGDFGVSSHQIDTPERGFSFRTPGPLDMRMDPSQGMSVAEYLEDIDEDELIRVLREYGEERYARRVARNILKEQPRTTQALAELVRRSLPRSKDNIDAATRTFQGLRIAINDELGEIRFLLEKIPDFLNDGGVAAFISFHSLEDRIVKRGFRSHARGCICPPSHPICNCGVEPTLEVLTRRPLIASDEERDENPRARSAKVRAAKRLPRLSKTLEKTEQSLGRYK